MASHQWGRSSLRACNQHVLPCIHIFRAPLPSTSHGTAWCVPPGYTLQPAVEANRRNPLCAHCLSATCLFNVVMSWCARRHVDVLSSQVLLWHSWPDNSLKVRALFLCKSCYAHNLALLSVLLSVLAQRMNSVCLHSILLLSALTAASHQHTISTHLMWLLINKSTLHN